MNKPVKSPYKVISFIDSSYVITANEEEEKNNQEDEIDEEGSPFARGIAMENSHESYETEADDGRPNVVRLDDEIAE